jgi:hypothetical protein
MGEAGMMGEGDEDEEDVDEKPKKKSKAPKASADQPVGEEGKQECKQQ